MFVTLLRHIEAHPGNHALIDFNTESYCLVRHPLTYIQGVHPNMVLSGLLGIRGGDDDAMLYIRVEMVLGTGF